MGPPVPLTQPGLLLPLGQHPERPRRASHIPPGLLPLLYLLGHPRGFMNCSRPPPGTSKPPGKGLQPSGGFHAHLRQHIPCSCPTHTPQNSLSRLTDRREENILWNLYVFIVDFASTWSPPPPPASPGTCARGCSGWVFTCLLKRRCLKPFRGAGGRGGRTGTRVEREGRTVAFRDHLQSGLFYLPVIRSPPGCPGTRLAALSSS